jgi:predicted SnoaL-like aldol condensation-catalyzing enzyme
MKNEPVAWIDEKTGCFVYSQYDYEDLDEYGKDGLIPLYTHPVKELTDEEINVVAILQDAEIVPVGHEIWKTGEEFNKYKKIVLATAKALRKVQEK